MPPVTQDLHALAERYTPDIVRFLRDMIAIPSESAEEGGVVARIADEMRAVCAWVTGSGPKPGCLR